jgi:hypothetical protein
MFGSGIRRPLPGAKGVDPEVARFAAHYDQLGLDSDYDYDPVWRKCVELKMAPTFHTGGPRRSVAKLAGRRPRSLEERWRYASDAARRSLSRTISTGLVTLIGAATG